MLFYLYLQFFGGLFSWIQNRIFMDTDPDFPYRIRICWAIRIRTQEKKSDPDPDKRTLHIKAVKSQNYKSSSSVPAKKAWLRNIGYDS